MSSLPKMPAYQEYPADILNNEVFIQLSMAQRGLLWTLRMYCWKNETIPAGYTNLARLTGISEKEVSKLFDEKVNSFFSLVHDENLGKETVRMINPDLEAYRKEKIAARIKRAASGKLGADKRWNHNEDGETITSAIAKEKRRHEHDYDPEHDFEKHMNMKGYQSLN